MNPHTLLKKTKKKQQTFIQNDESSLPWWLANCLIAQEAAPYAITGIEEGLCNCYAPNWGIAVSTHPSRRLQGRLLLFEDWGRQGKYTPGSPEHQATSHIRLAATTGE